MDVSQVLAIAFGLCVVNLFLIAHTLQTALNKTRSQCEEWRKEAESLRRERDGLRNQMESNENATRAMQLSLNHQASELNKRIALAREVLFPERPTTPENHENQQDIDTDE